MLRPTLFLAFASVAVVALAAAPSTSDSPAPSADPPKICKMVTDNTPTKPFQMCMSKADWGAKAIADAKDPNRMVCHYEEEPGTRLHGRKICMTAAEWADARFADRQAVERIQAGTCVPGGGC